MDIGSAAFGIMSLFASEIPQRSRGLKKKKTPDLNKQAKRKAARKARRITRNKHR